MLPKLLGSIIVHQIFKLNKLLENKSNQFAPLSCCFELLPKLGNNLYRQFAFVAFKYQSPKSFVIVIVTRINPISHRKVKYIAINTFMQYFILLPVSTISYNIFPLLFTIISFKNNLFVRKKPFVNLCSSAYKGIEIKIMRLYHYFELRMRCNRGFEIQVAELLYLY